MSELKQGRSRKNDIRWRLENSVKTIGDYWVWQKYTNECGYGRLRHKGKKELAHRVSYKINVGEIPEGMRVCHACDNPPCINPQHLFLGTDKDNVADCIAKGRHKGILNSPFVKGHEYYAPRK